MSKSESRTEEVAERLLRFRETTGLSQREFAEKIGVSSGQYNDWEKGRSRVSLQGALKIYEIFGLSLDWLFLNRADALSHKMAIDLASRPSAK